METISTTFKVDRLHQIKSVRRVLEKSNDNMSILSRDVIVGANAYLYTNRNILLTTFIKKDSNGKAIATIDTDFGLGSIYAGVNVFGKGDYSLNIGKDNNVNTNYSAAIGTGLVPTTNNGIVIGQYNKIDTRARYLVIGGGTSDKKRKDLVTINTAGVTEINNSDNANGLNTGALRVVGGILSQGTNYFTNITRITQKEDAEETLQTAAANTGALRVTGGIYSGGKNWFANRTVINNADAANSNGTKGALKVAGGIYTGKANYFNSATTITGITKITDTTEADASHGALQIDGGIKVGKCAYVKDLNVTNQATISSTENLLFGSESLASLLSEKAPIATTVQVPSDQKSIGDSSTPVYINNTIVTACSKYAGGTAITLNGTPKGATTASFYAPTTSGSNGYILQAQQNGEPQWVSPTSNDFVVGNAVSARKLTTTSAGSSTRPIYFSNGIPVASTLIRGSSIEPVFFYNGEITACSPYAGGTKIILNGTDKGANTASFYAPTTSGSDKQVLISKGANRSPEWVNASSDLAVSSATKLATSRNLKVNLANNYAQSFNGTNDATNIGVSGILPEAYGGTGVEKVQKSIMTGLGGSVDIGTYTMAWNDKHFEGHTLWIDKTYGEVQDATIRYAYNDGTPTSPIYLWGHECNKIGGPVTSSIYIGEMTRLPSVSGYSYTFTTNSQGKVGEFKRLLNIQNVSFTVSTSSTAHNKIYGKDNILTTVVAELKSMNEQKLEDVLKTVLKDIKTLKNKIS